MKIIYVSKKCMHIQYNPFAIFIYTNAAFENRILIKTCLVFVLFKQEIKHAKVYTNKHEQKFILIHKCFPHFLTEFLIYSHDYSNTFDLPSKSY